jgi:hypothetical protein
MCLRTRALAVLLLCISSCVFSGFSFAQDVPFRRTEIDSAFQGDGKAIGDIDGDGLADIIVAGQKLVWYRAPGWAKTIIASGVDFGTDIQVGDVDNDGDLDIIAPDTLEKENVLWFENPRPRGNPAAAAWTKHVIGTFGGVGSPHPHDTEVGDIDGDGRLDVVTRRGRTTVWLQVSPDSWTKVDLVGATPGVEGTALADLDKDGNLDIVTGEQRGTQKLMIWENDGKGNFDGHLVDSGKETHLGARVFDLDGDGDFDILGHCWDTPKYLHLWRNDALGSVATNPAVGNKGEESASLDRMRQCRAGQVTLVYAPESERIARDIVRYAAMCNQRLAQWFQPASPVAQKVYWMARQDWRNKPETYGFPYANGSDAYLPASDVDLPTQLTYIADSMAIPAGGPSVDRMIRLLQLPEGADPRELYTELKQSRDFFLVFTTYFILPHELTHGFCNHLAYPPQPRWCYEGIAQWAAYKIQGQLRSPREADMIDQYYQLLWERATDLKVRDFARADALGAGKSSPPFISSNWRNMRSNPA